MPKKTERTWDPQQQKYVERTVGQDEDVVSKSKMQNASGLGSRVQGSAFVPPTQKEGEDSAAYGARVAAARRKWEAKQKTRGAQAAAVE